MGLTLIRKSMGHPPKRNPKVALVLAGGAVSGGAFKVGGLKALNDYLVGRNVTQFDTYVGLSAGAILAIPLAGGIEPDEMIRVLEGTSDQFDQLRPIDFYNPNWREFAARPVKFAYDLMSYLPGVTNDFLRGLPGLPEAVGEAATRLFREPSYTHLEGFVMAVIDHTSPRRELPALTNHIPSGLFDNSSLERWMRRSLERSSLPNDFRAFQRKRQVRLYLSACDLDTAERVIFGADENCEVTIAQAMQASTALPIFYKPARLNGIDYVDGGVRNTANIDVAIEKGADLIVCYNPFRPFLNRTDEESVDPQYFADGRYLSDRGMKLVLNQVFRTLLHSRLKLGLQRYLADDRFRGDIVLLEPREHDRHFFAVNPMAFWKRAEAVQHGFESVRDTIERNFDQLSEVFGQYGIDMSRETAHERARELREERGWDAVDESTDSSEERPLRLVRA
ncbi:MAG TPA: hypothetical protein ENO23_05665 [Alphaproteobacteria bacterium]|nr:hypothetical protein [Alphaproteobacteria bacterium]